MTILDDVMDVAEELELTAVIIGGMALPAYNVVRNTLDLDLSIFFQEQRSIYEFLEKLEHKGYKTLQNPTLSHDLFGIFGHHSEAEIWLKPCDAFEWDEEMEKHIKLAANISSHFYVLSVEDYILTKLARTDRSAYDITDILQILIQNYQSMDWQYFASRLKQYKYISSIRSILEDSTSLDREESPELVLIFTKIKEKLEREILKFNL